MQLVIGKTLLWEYRGVRSLHGSGPQGDNGMRLTVKGVETGTDCVKPFGSQSFTGRGVGLEKTTRT